MTGTVFGITEAALHDGPGVRVTVFLKGCPLRCVWCHNPEGLSPEPECVFRETLCTHCLRCRRPCTHPECRPFGRCLHACPNGCLSLCGERVDAEALAGRLARYAPMLSRMGGGVTFSGGEPLRQADFVCAVAARLPGVHLALETSGYADAVTYRRVCGRMDYVMQDIKLADRAAHIRYTGVPNDRILENIAWLKESGKPFSLRVPLIPGITDTEENLSRIAAIAGDAPVVLLRANPLAGAKYAMVGRPYTLPDRPPRAEDLTHYFRRATMG